MPGPPTEIRIKRKATDDPVELLHVQNEFNCIRQIKQYVFKRQRTSTSLNGNTLNPSDSSFRRIQQSMVSSFTASHRVSDLKTLQFVEVPPPNGQVVALRSKWEVLPNTDTTRTHTDLTSGTVENRPLVPRSEPRRFHLSRDSIHNPGVRTQGAEGPPAVFIERRRLTELGSKTSNATIPQKDGQKSHGQVEYENGKPLSTLCTIYTEPSLTAPLQKAKLPSGNALPWDVNSSKLATEMQAYTLREIGKNLEKASEPQTLATSTQFLKTRKVSGFNPKLPPLSYQERLLEQNGDEDEKKERSQDEQMTDVADADDNESGYVMDSYIRVPADTFDLQGQTNVGLLVLESQPDIDYFYNDYSDTDSEIYDEEEDENAENHPSTDYPEDEVESDDEYGRSAFKFYRNHNASDNENYDGDDVTYSDDEAKLPWARRPWMANDAYTENEDDMEDDY